MDAVELARWTRFAAKGGIGKCTAVQDCIAESAEDLMFLKDDEIIVLLQSSEMDGVYLGYCEGVVGRFRGSHVHFHAKLKKPVMAKRGSVTTGKSPSPSFKSVTSMLPNEASQRRDSDHSRIRTSIPVTDSVPTPPRSGSSNTGTFDVMPSTPLINLPPEAILNSSSPAPTTNISQRRAIHHLHTISQSHYLRTWYPLQLFPFHPPNRRHHPTLLSHKASTPHQFRIDIRQDRFIPPWGPYGGDGDDDDWSSTPSHSDMESPAPSISEQVQDESMESSEADRTEEAISTREADDIPKPTLDTSPRTSVSPQPLASSPGSGRRPSLAPSSSSSKRSEDWEGASDIYDDYRYSRYSMASKLSRFSLASHPSTSTVPPPVPDHTTRLERKLSVDSEASVYTQASKRSIATASPVSSQVDMPPPTILDPPRSQLKDRPAPLELLTDRSPLLHTTWGSPIPSPAALSASSSAFFPNTPAMFTSPTNGIASALRQRLEIERPQPSPISPSAPPSPPSSPPKHDGDGSLGGIVIDDDDDPPSRILDTSQDSELHASPSPTSSKSVSPALPSVVLPPLVISDRKPSPPLLSPTVENEPPSPMVPSAPPITSPQPQPSTDTKTPIQSPVLDARPRPSLLELRGQPPNAPPGQRRSFFSPTPMPRNQTRPPVGQCTSGLKMHSYHLPFPSSLPNKLDPRWRWGSTDRRLPAIYARTLIDLASAQAAVPIIFSFEPPPPNSSRAVASPPNRPTIPSGTSPAPQPLQPAPYRVEADKISSVPPPSQPAAGSSADSEKPNPGSNTTGAIPRTNFMPKAGTARPRSRSFSGFNTPSKEPVTPMPRSREEGNQPSQGPYTPESKRSVSTLGTSPTVSPSNSPGKTPSPANPSPLRASHSLSPLSLSRSVLNASQTSPKPPSSPLAQSAVPLSPTSRLPHQLRQVSSHPNLEQPTSPPATARPAAASHIAPSNASIMSQPSVDNDTLSEHSETRSQVSSPPPLFRQSSLRTKLSLPNLRRNRSRQDEGAGSYAPDVDTVQVQDMDFELVRPNIAQFQSPRASGDSNALVREGSLDIRVELNSAQVRTDSPAVSVSSGNKEPATSVSTSVDVSGSWQPRVNHKGSDSESSMDAHRQREQKWMTLMSSVTPAQARKSKKVKKLILEGVPSSVRYLVWSHLIDGKARVVPGVYAQLGRRERIPKFDEIEVDATKCFDELPQLGSMQTQLMALLQAYLTMVPDVRYTTGLIYVAGHLLLLAPEEDAFWTFVSIMDTHLRPYFSPSTTQIEVDAALFSRALEANDSGVAKKVWVDMGVNPSTICQPWFSSLFVNALPTEYLNRIWDLFLFDGIPFLIRVGLAIFSCCRRQILECTSEGVLLRYLRKPSSSWLPSTVDGFISLACSFKLKDDDVRKQRVKMEQIVKRQTQAPKIVSMPGAISLPRT
ncbi:rab-GTPase-TBC domain-containing protein [Infundibulicybe gibba]|nr:rab-GTPase-TBC domain-containing protein [Infundibulicybe gibba]